MRYIGFYYSPDGLFNLYAMDYVAPNWVSNICYYNYYTKSYYSPSLYHISKYGRTDAGQTLPAHVWVANFT